MNKKRKVLKIIKNKSCTRKELLEKIQDLNISENYLGIILNRLKNQNLIEKIDKKYVYCNPFSKALEVQDIKDKKIAIYETMLKLIPPFKTWKQLNMLREAVYLNGGHLKIEF